MKKTIIADGVRPTRTKYDIQKTRPMSDYFEGKAPMQSDKLKIRLINEGYLDEECTICARRNRCVSLSCIL